MELDELKNRVDNLKEAQEKGHGGLNSKELLLLWEFVQSISDNGSDEHKKLADYLMSSGIKSVGQGAQIEDHKWKKPFTSFAEFESAVSNEVPFKM